MSKEKRVDKKALILGLHDHPEVEGNLGVDHRHVIINVDVYAILMQYKNLIATTIRDMK